MKHVIKILGLIAIGVAVGKSIKVNHYMTKYIENEKKKAESWIQVDFLNNAYTFSKREMFLD